MRTGRRVLITPMNVVIFAIIHLKQDFSSFMLQFKLCLKMTNPLQAFTTAIFICIFERIFLCTPDLYTSTWLGVVLMLNFYLRVIIIVWGTSNWIGVAIAERPPKHPLFDLYKLSSGKSAISNWHTGEWRPNDKFSSFTLVGVVLWGIACHAYHSGFRHTYTWLK